MFKKSGKLGIVVSFTAIILLATMFLTLIYSEVGMAKDIGIQEPELPVLDFSSVPQSVIDDAVRIAGELAGKSKEKIKNLVDQLVATYVEARDKDVVVFFNSGGMGWNLTKDTPGWESILNGIKTQLEKQGYNPLVLNYRRTSSGILGCIKEFFEAANRYPHKAQDLADRVKFLVDNLPDLKVIIAGESTGTVISDKTMIILEDNQSVYSIQTGTPFWHKPVILERTLLMNSNGRGIDTFSYGNIPAMIWATVRGWLGLSSPDENPGNILSWLKAPGHDYSWQYPGVCSAVMDFLEGNFGAKDLP
ncbi:MAG: hypothetical protein A2Y90_00875 [Chloroflexi bacterium RBG_13_52_12]|nr:MAG: hypothetical protein A2Y90_00875 [Chloroflexi bacterium RBG_13_52_12]